MHGHMAVQVCGADTASTSRASVDGQGLLQEQLRRVADIMEGVGRQGRVSSSALRELLAHASAHILLLTTPIDGHLRALVRCCCLRRMHGGGCDGARGVLEDWRHACACTVDVAGAASS